MGGRTRQHYRKEAVTTPIASGTTAEVAAATGGDNGSDYSDALCGEELRFEIGEARDSVTGRRSERQRLGMAWQRQWQQQGATTRAGTGAGTGATILVWRRNGEVVSFAMGRNGFFLSLICELIDGSICRPPVGNCLLTLPTDKSVAKSPLWFYRRIFPSSYVCCVITDGYFCRYFSHSRSVAKSVGKS